MKTKIIVIFILSILCGNISSAYTESYSKSNYGSSWSENEDTYCSEETNKKGIITKLKNAFVGQPTGYTPQIPASSYLNPYYGPSYQQGYYTGNPWNSHNVYNPTIPTKLFGMSF